MLIPLTAAGILCNLRGSGESRSAALAGQRAVLPSSCPSPSEDRRLHVPRRGMRRTAKCYAYATTSAAPCTSLRPPQARADGGTSMSGAKNPSIATLLATTHAPARPFVSP